jgi:hypothetical protein
MKYEEKRQEYEFVYASQVFDDDNKGFVFGVNWLDEEGYIVDCEWFQTEEEREIAVIGCEQYKERE